VKYADPVAQQEIDRLRAGSDNSEPDFGEQWTPAQVWYALLEAPVWTRHHLLGKFLQAQDDANRCFLEGHVVPE